MIFLDSDNQAQAAAWLHALLPADSHAQISAEDIRLELFTLACLAEHRDEALYVADLFPEVDLDVLYRPEGTRRSEAVPPLEGLSSLRPAVMTAIGEAVLSALDVGKCDTLECKDPFTGSALFLFKPSARDRILQATGTTVWRDAA